MSRGSQDDLSMLRDAQRIKHLSKFVMANNKVPYLKCAQVSANKHVILFHSPDHPEHGGTPKCILTSLLNKTNEMQPHPSRIPATQTEQPQLNSMSLIVCPTKAAASICAVSAAARPLLLQPVLAYLVHHDLAVWWQYVGHLGLITGCEFAIHIVHVMIVARLNMSKQNEKESGLVDFLHQAGSY